MILLGTAIVAFFVLATTKWRKGSVAAASWRDRVGQAVADVDGLAGEVARGGVRTPEGWAEVSARESAIGGQLRVLADTAPSPSAKASVDAAVSGLSGLVASRQAVDLRVAASPPPDATERAQLDQRLAEAQRALDASLAELRKTAGIPGEPQA